MPEIYINQEYSLKEKIWSFFRLFLIGLIIDAFIVFSLYLIIYSPIFKIQEIKISGNNQLSEKETMDFVIINLFNDSFFKKILTAKNILIWPNELKNNSKMFLVLDKVLIKKDLINQKIEIIAQERKPVGLWCQTNESQCYWFDNDGILFKKTIASEGGLILKIKDSSLHNLSLGSKILPDNFLKTFFQIIEVLKSSNLNFSEINLENLDLAELKVKNFNGPDIYFSLIFPPPDINQIITDFKNKNIFDKLEYLDFRVENRLYYK
ncbi:MAG: cell division protein FtsQ/DivIB [Minisyncoccia bacterium]